MLCTRRSGSLSALILAAVTEVGREREDARRKIETERARSLFGA